MSKPTPQTPQRDAGVSDKPGSVQPAVSAVYAAINLANASHSWSDQEPAMRAFAELCPEDGIRITHHRALKVLADEVLRLRGSSQNDHSTPMSAATTTPAHANDAKRGTHSVRRMVMPHSCDCKNYNGGQCYNCRNGFHSGCSGRCKKPNARSMGLQIQPAGSAETCANCDYWTFRGVITPPKTNIGYCDLFRKLTESEHGLQCTGWTPRNSPNAAVALHPLVSGRPTRAQIINAARAQDPDIGDEAMIVDGEWSYCVAASVFVDKAELRKSANSVLCDKSPD